MPEVNAARVINEASREKPMALSLSSMNEIRWNG
jgi:hypothetical protein